MAYLDSNNTLAAHFLHGVGDYGTNLYISIGRDCSNLGNPVNISVIKSYERLLDVYINKFLINIWKAWLT